MRSARIRIARVAFAIVLVGVVWIAALAADDILDPHSQVLSVFRRAPETVATLFGLCAKDDPGENCVLDGGAFRYRGRRVTVAGIDAPRRLEADCPEEAASGEKSAKMLQTLLNAGSFEMMLIPTRSPNFQRDALRRNGEYFADRLIDAGLARRRVLFRRSWCP